ncbi:MAG: tetratricopeptide repeat protein, partial [Pyrinomonadaceae bacterium]|nr:tetratricopeptide repeat protein [Pyrinomonadaceae bacterium]
MQTPSSAFARASMLLLIAAIVSGCSTESKKARFSERAERFFTAGDYDKAKIEYLKLLRIDPENSRAFSRIGQMWAEEGAPLRAGQFLVRARELAPSDLQNRIKLARVLSSIGQRAEARKEAIAILEQSPAETNALMLLVETALSPEDVAFAEEQLQKFPERESAGFFLAAANLALRKGDAASAEDNLRRALSLDPKSAPAHTAMAILQLFKKNIPEAGQEFKTAAELAPGRSSESLKYAEFTLQTGAPEDVKTFLNRVVAQAPDFVAAWSLLGQVALREKKYDEAIKLVENVFSRDPDNLDARMVQASAWMAKGESRKAAESLERLDKSYPNIPLIKFRLAQAYVQNGNPAQAVAALDQALSVSPGYTDALLLRAEIRLKAREPQPVIFEMVQLLKKQPAQLQARALLADAYRAVGRLDDAAAVMQEQINLQPNSWQPYEMLGVILRQQNKRDEARKAFEKAAELNPESLGTIEQLVDLDIAARDFASATNRVQQLRQKVPESATAHLMEGKIHAAQGKFDQAEAAFVKASDLDPNSSAAYDLLVSLYVSANRLPDAVRQLEALLSKKPGDTRALTVAALIYEKTNDWAKARDAYEKLLAVNPNSVPALNNLAYLYSERFNDLEKANDLAQKAHAMEPTNPSPTDTLGWILYKKGDYQQAVTLLQESSGKLPDNPEIQFHLGMANYMMGQTEGARAALQKA